MSTSKHELKIIFAGTPEFAAVALESLLASNHQIVAVYTQPDRKAGRGLKLKASAVKELAIQNRLPVHQPKTLKDEHEKQILRDYQADVMVVAAYGMLLPADVLHIPRHGCINIHPSLLPRWRGAAPIQRTIYAGDKDTGVTIMQMNEGLDTGDILVQKHYHLMNEETSATLHDKLAVMGASAMIETLHLLADEKLQPIPQDNQFATYAQKISKEEALIDWSRSAEKLACEIRAFNPWPVAYTSWHEQNFRIWSAIALNENHNVSPRTIIRASREGLDIATGKGVLRLLQVQLPGGKVMSIEDFYNSKQRDLIVGEHLI